MAQKQKRKNKIGSIQKDILQKLTGGDIFMAFLLSARSSRNLYKEAHKRASIRFQYQRGIGSLQRGGYVHIHNDLLQLTHKGKELAEALSARDAASTGAWKGRWWLVMYDIPISINSYRFELRSILIGSGFKKLQQSVWIHFQPCKELETFLKRNPIVNKFVRYFEVLPSPHLENMEDWEKLPTA